MKANVNFKAPRYFGKVRRWELKRAQKNGMLRLSSNEQAFLDATSKLFKAEKGRV